MDEAALPQNNKKYARIDPDWVSISALIISALGAVPSWVAMIARSKDNEARNSRLEDRPFRDATRNMLDATFDIRRALDKIEQLFLADQQRRASSDFSLPPRFGNQRAWFDRDEFADFKNANLRLLQSTNAFRQWAINFEEALLKFQHPRELALMDELFDLDQQLNAALFDAETAQQQIQLIRQSLERIERALEGLNRRN